MDNEVGRRFNKIDATLDGIKNKLDGVDEDLYEIKNPSKFKDGDEVIIIHFKKLKRAIYRCRSIEKTGEYEFLEEHYVDLIDGDKGIKAYYVFAHEELKNV